MPTGKNVSIGIIVSGELNALHEFWLTVLITNCHISDLGIYNPGRIALTVISGLSFVLVLVIQGSILGHDTYGCVLVPFLPDFK